MVGIEDLPQDLFYQICSYLQISDLVAVSTVCRQFSHWLGRQSYWKWRLQNLWNGKYPCLPGKIVDWSSVCFEREKCFTIFGNDSCECFRVSKLNAVDEGIDALHIPLRHSELLLVGGREKVVSIFSFKSGLLSDAWHPIFTESNSHSGWLWTINSTDDTVITGGWDSVVRVWKLTNSGLAPQSVYEVSSPVLCSSFLDSNTLAIGTQGRYAYLLDLRSFEKEPSALRHRGAVVCMDSIYESGLSSVISNEFIFSRNNHANDGLARGDHVYAEYSSHSDLSSIAASEENFCESVVDPFEIGNLILDNCASISPKVSTKSEQDKKINYKREDTETVADDLSQSHKYSFSNFHLFTGSSDQHIAGWDVRNASCPVHRLKLTRLPRKISLLDENELWVAEPPNRVHVFDIRDNHLNCAYTNQLPGWDRGFGGIKATSGCIFVAGLHGSVEAFHPTCPLLPMGGKPLQEKIFASPTSLEYCNDILVSGSGDGSIYIWSSSKRMKSLISSD
uniref:F-box domain-containing protein n=1 Tax=Trichobilharzia regenti TaxID=157069 RepID=A0AA85JGX2_TRIRE|nr:unnamed protein product [Trichobilharzia regenti]